MDLNTYGKALYRATANVGVTTANKIVFEDYADWASFPMGLSVFAHDMENDTYYQITGAAFDTPAVGQVELTLLTPAAASGAVAVEIVPGWTDFGGAIYFQSIVFDNNSKVLGAEMYAYLNIPKGDQGRDDLRYKYSCMANDRLFIFGTPEDVGYFSVKNRPDVIPAQNILFPKSEPTGCIDINRDAFLFYKNGASRYTVISNTKAEKDDEFLEIGLTGQQALVKINDDQVAFMSYKGPYVLTGRTPRYIGESLKTWWQKTASFPYITEAQMLQCRVFYNNLREQIWFSFPTYNDAGDYTTGIVFVFDSRAFRKGLEAWWIIGTDTPMYNGTLANDLHLLTGNNVTKIVDWNNTGVPDETCDTLIKFKLLKNPDLVERHKILFKTVFVRSNDNDTIVTKVYFDGASSATTLTLNADKQAAINYIKETLELELSTAASANDVEYESAVITLVPRKR